MRKGQVCPSCENISITLRNKPLSAAYIIRGERGGACNLVLFFQGLIGEMGGREENRIFVGGIGWNTTERLLQDTFSRYGKIVDCLVMTDRNTGRPRGFGFITFADRRGMEDALRDMHGRELDGRVISVNRADPKMGADNPDYGYGGTQVSGAREPRDSYRADSRSDECFKCGRLGHWARDCPTSASSDRYSSRGDRYRDDRYDDHFQGGRLSDRDRLGSRDRYAPRDRYESERYLPVDDRFGDDRYGAVGYGQDRIYERERGLRGGDRYGGGGPSRHDQGAYRDSRAAPYDNPRKRGRVSSYNRY